MYNPVLDGLMQGLHAGTAMRNIRFQEEQQLRQKQQDQRNAEMRDFDVETRMQRLGARPVDETGLVSEAILADGGPIAGQVGGNLMSGMQLGEVMRKPKNAVRYRTSKGEMRQWEVPSEEEQRSASANRSMNEYRNKQSIDDFSRLQAQKDYFDHTEAARALREQRKESKPTATPKAPTLKGTRLSADGKIQFNTYSDGSIEEKPLASPAYVPGSGKGKSTSGGAGKSGGMTPGQQAVQERFNKKREDDAQEEVRNLQAKEDKLHSRKIEIGAAMKAGLPSDKKGSAEEHQAKLTAELASLDQGIASLQSQKQKVVDNFKSGKGAAGGASATPSLRYNPRSGRVEPISKQ